MIVFCYDKVIDMLQLAFPTLNLASICLYKSTDAKFYPFTEAVKDLLEKNRDVVVGPFIVFTPKAVVEETFIRKSTNLCKSLVATDSSKVNPYSIHKPVYSQLGKTRPVALKILSCLIFNEQDLIVKLRASMQEPDSKKMINLVSINFCPTSTLCLKHWAAFTTFVFVKGYVRLSLKKISNAAVRRGNSVH